MSRTSRATFTEPAVDANAERLASTGRDLGSPPPQLDSNGKHARHHRSQTGSERQGSNSNVASPNQTPPPSTGDTKLALKLKLGSKRPSKEKPSNVRQTPKRGAEDYRHKRLHLTVPSRPPAAKAPKRTKSRRQTRATFEETDDELSDLEKLPPNAEPSPPTPASPHPAKPRQKKLKLENENKEPKPRTIINNDYCASCGGTGELICCETCVRSFHFCCAEPPVMSIEEVQEDIWQCRHCLPRNLPPQTTKQLSKLMLAPLFTPLAKQNPSAFQLPVNMQRMFEKVGVNKFGEFYDVQMKVESAQEDKILDKQGRAMLCYKCKKSRLVNSLAVCSLCKMAWHIDCVDPPLESTPLGYWVCPLHVEYFKTLPRQPTAKLRRACAVTMKRNVLNQGNIEVIGYDEESDSESGTAVDTGASTGATDATDAAADGAMDSSDENINSDIPSIPTDREKVEYDEAHVRTMKPAHQSRVEIENGDLVPGGKPRPKTFDLDTISYEVPARSIKLDFISAVCRERQQQQHVDFQADLMYSLDRIAEQPQQEREGVRNLMALKLQGAAVNQATARQNLKTLIQACHNQDDEILQAAAIRKLILEKGKDKLFRILRDM